MSEKETSTLRQGEPTAAKSTTRQEEPNTVKATPPPPKPDEESTAVKRALLFMYWVAALLGSDYVFTLSSGPNYFTRIDTGGAFDMRDSEPTKAANTQFSNAWTIWAAGHRQRVHCLRAAHRRLLPHRGLRRRRSAVPHEALRGDDQGRRGGGQGDRRATAEETVQKTRGCGGSRTVTVSQT